MKAIMFMAAIIVGAMSTQIPMPGNYVIAVVAVVMAMFAGSQ